MEYRDLIRVDEDGVTTVTLNRPEVLNALSPNLAHELLHVVESTANEDATKVLVITGTGRGFSAGADLAAIVQEREADKDYDQRDGSGGAEIASDAQPTELPVVVKYYPEDESVFPGNEYLIKGVAGGILWRLLRHYVDGGREEFSNRELRLDTSLALPDIKDNLEARLILLRKRLEERCDYLRIEKVARGRFHLDVSRPISLVSADETDASSA